MRCLILMVLMSLFSVAWGQSFDDIDISGIPKATQAVGIRYWFDDNTESQSISTQVGGSYTFDVSAFPFGLHTLHCQIVDEANLFAIPYSAVFLKTSESPVRTETAPKQLCYWFDEETTKNTGSLTGGIQMLDASHLSYGLHTLHYQVVDSEDENCHVVSSVFLKTSEPPIRTETATKELCYWFDEEETKSTGNLTGGIQMLDVSHLNYGLHTLHYQVIDSEDEKCHVVSSVFVKWDAAAITTAIEKQRYWFDDDSTNVHESNFVNGVQMIDASELSDGEHTINYQVIDQYGAISETLTATFIKEGGDIRILIVKRHYTDEDIAKAQLNPNILVVKWENGETLPLSIRNGMNPNLITYAEEGVEIEGGFKNSRNVVQNGKANELVLTDRSPLLITEPFTASKAQYTRHFEKETTIGDAAGWESIVLPYPVQKITTEDGRTLAPFGSPIPADVNFWLGRMVNGGFEHATKILANVPYVIAMPNSNSYRDEYNVEGNVTFTSTSVKVHATDEETANYSIFKPTYEEVADYADLYAINDDEYDAHPAGSVFVRGLRAIRPFEGYITKDFVNGAAPRTVIPIMNNDETGIVDVTRKPGNGKVYSIDGRRINSSTLSTGLYIINGRKVVVK